METKIHYMMRRLQQLRDMKPEIILPAQRYWPNCGRYKKCCTKDKDFWDGIDPDTVIPKPDVIATYTTNNLKKPKGFEDIMVCKFE